MKAMFVAHSSVSLKDVFDAWKLLAWKGSRRRMREKIHQLTRCVWRVNSQLQCAIVCVFVFHALPFLACAVHVVLQ